MKIQNAYNQIKAALKAGWMSNLQTETLTVNSLTDCDNLQAWSMIKDFQPTQGWVQTLDAVHLIESGQLPKNDNDQQDHLISAELVNVANESLHIRPASKGKLGVVRYTPNQGESYYVTETNHEIKHTTKTESGNKTFTGQATYRIYWDVSTPKTQPVLSRLIEIMH